MQILDHGLTDALRGANRLRVILRRLTVLVVRILLLAKLGLLAGLLAPQTLGLVFVGDGLRARVGEVHLEWRGQMVEIIRTETDIKNATKMSDRAWVLDSCVYKIRISSRGGGVKQKCFALAPTTNEFAHATSD